MDKSVSMNKELESDLYDACIKVEKILPIVTGAYLGTDRSIRAYCIRVAREPIMWADGTTTKVHHHTIRNWYKAYMEGGKTIDVFLPKPRPDKGVPRVLDDDAMAFIHDRLVETPDISSTAILKKLKHKYKTTKRYDSVNVCAVQRYVKSNSLRAQVQSSEDYKPRLAYEMEKFGELWQADTCHEVYINDGAGNTRKCYCIQIIDDYTRMIVGGEYFFEDSSYNFQKVLYDAILTFGIPQKLYVDNGSSYNSVQLKAICLDLGISHDTCEPYSPEEKGKIERSFGTLHTMLTNTIDPRKIQSLEHMNELYYEFLNEYHNKYHSSIKMTPLQRYEEAMKAGKSVARMYEKGQTAEQKQQWIDEVNFKFMHRVKRKVKKDNTIQIDNLLYDIPPALLLVGKEIEVRFHPFDPQSLSIIVVNGKKIKIHPTDKARNGKKSRNDLMDYPELDYSLVPIE